MNDERELCKCLKFQIKVVHSVQRKEGERKGHDEKVL